MSISRKKNPPVEAFIDRLNKEFIAPGNWRTCAATSSTTSQKTTSAGTVNPASGAHLTDETHANADNALAFRRERNPVFFTSLITS